MKVVILCGGKGIRLYEETEFRPKPMVPIGDRPILWHIMQRYAKYGYTEFILCLGYRGEQIREYFAKGGAGYDGNWQIEFAETGLESMTGYRVRAIRGLVGTGPFFLTYGDGVGNIDVRKGLDFHNKSGAACTLTAVHPPGRFGEIGFGTKGEVVRFNEKPQTESGYINGGFMTCGQEVFDYLPDDPTLMFEQKPLSRMLADGKLAAYQHQGFWQPMDTRHEYLLLNRLWESGRPPWTD